MKIRLFSLVFLLGSLYLIVSLSRDLVRLARKGKDVEVARAGLDKLKDKNSELKRRLQEILSPGFVEKEARDKLGMTKPNETVLILPKSLEDRLGNQVNTKTDTSDPNWKRWWKLFF